MKDIEVKQVVISNLTTYGDGVRTPIRRITKVHDFNGEEIASSDPLAITHEQAVRFANYARHKAGNVSIGDLFEWINREG